jgi:hypothetical protein
MPSKHVVGRDNAARSSKRGAIRESVARYPLQSSSRTLMAEPIVVEIAAPRGRWSRSSYIAR